MYKVLLVSGLTLAIALITLPVPESKAQVQVPLVKIAVVNTLTRGLPSAIVTVAMQPLKTYMETQTGMSGEIVVGGDALDLAQKLDDESFHIGVFHGFEYAWAKSKFTKLEPIVICNCTSPNIRAVHVVSSKSKVQSYADLKGKTLALPRENRAYCRLYAERRCVKPGTTTSTYYKSVTSPVECEEALDSVVRGKVDSAIVDGPLLDEYKKNKPAWAKHLRVLSQSDLFAPGVIAYRKGKFSEQQVGSLRTALLNAHTQTRGKEVMTTLRVGSFSTAPTNFQKVLDASVKAYPPPTK